MKKNTTDRRKEARALIQPGSILLLENDFATTEKFVIVASADPVLLCFVINSKINPFIREQPSRAQCQVCLRRADHAHFLIRDSYADCSEVLNKIPMLRAISQLVADGSRLKGRVTDGERQAVIAAIKLTRLLSRAQKRHLLTAWGEKLEN